MFCKEFSMSLNVFGRAVRLEAFGGALDQKLSRLLVGTNTLPHIHLLGPVDTKEHIANVEYAYARNVRATVFVRLVIVVAL